MARRLMHSIGIKKIGGMALVLSFVAVACVAGQPRVQLNDPTGVDPGGQNTVSDGGKGLQQAEPEEVKCPPKSYTYTNSSSGAVTIYYSCEENNGGATTVPAGGSVTFKESCGIGPNEEPEPDCIPCGLTSLDDPGGRRFSCELQQVYSAAYGINLAAIGYTLTDSDLKLPKKIYDVDGNLIRLRYFAIPVIDENGEFVEWELTTIKPNFSVEDGEVVIRDNFKRVIGNRTGITLEK